MWLYGLCNLLFKSLKSTASNGEKHYKEVPEDFILATKAEITRVFQEGLDQGIIPKDYFEAMDPKDKKAGKFCIWPDPLNTTGFRLFELKQHFFLCSA